MKICGIDPGLTGGIAFYDGNVVEACRVPTFKIANKKILDMEAICKLMVFHEPDLVCIEQQQAMPRQGVSSTFKTGFNYGIYIGILHALGYSYSVVIPRKWKADLSVTSDKNQARMRATELMPDGHDSWSLKCEDGVAEAALIAYWGLYCGQSPSGLNTGLSAKNFTKASIRGLLGPDDTLPKQ